MDFSKGKTVPEFQRQKRLRPQNSQQNGAHVEVTQPTVANSVAGRKCEGITKRKNSKPNAVVAKEYRNRQKDRISDLQNELESLKATAQQAVDTVHSLSTSINTLTYGIKDSVQACHELAQQVKRCVDVLVEKNASEQNSRNPQKATHLDQTTLNDDDRGSFHLAQPHPVHFPQGTNNASSSSGIDPLNYRHHQIGSWAQRQIMFRSPSGRIQPPGMGSILTVTSPVGRIRQSLPNSATGRAGTAAHTSEGNSHISGPRSSDEQTNPTTLLSPLNNIPENERCVAEIYARNFTLPVDDSYAEFLPSTIIFDTYGFDGSEY